MTAFGDHLFGLRKQKGWTQRQLAARLGVSDKAVSKWETGEAYPDITLLRPLAALFGVSADSLLRGGVDAPPADFPRESTPLPRSLSRSEWRKYSRKHATPKWNCMLKAMRVCAVVLMTLAAVCVVGIFNEEYVSIVVTAATAAWMIGGGILIVAQLHTDYGFLPFGERWTKLLLRHKLMTVFAYELFLLALWTFYGATFYAAEEIVLVICVAIAGVVWALAALTLFVSDLVLWCRDRDEFCANTPKENIE